MNAKRKVNTVFTHRLVSESGHEGIEFTGYERATAIGTATLWLHKVSEENKHVAMRFGLTQRCANGGAKGQGSTGREKFAGLAKIVEHLNSGSPEWRTAGEQRGGLDRDAGDVLMALTRAKRADGSAYAKDAEEANRIVARWAEAKGVDRNAAIAAWLKTKAIAAEVADIRAERERARLEADTTEAVDVEDLLEEADA